MVDVSEKNQAFRTARAHARVILNKETFEKIK
jgi:molybdenum cofactor biosynthesis enzyme